MKPRDKCMSGRNDFRLRKMKRFCWLYVYWYTKGNSPCGARSCIQILRHCLHGKWQVKLWSAS